MRKREKNISKLAKQNKTKERVKKSIEKKAAQLTKTKEQTAGLENDLNSTKPLEDKQETELQEKKSSKTRQ